MQTDHTSKTFSVQSAHSIKDLKRGKMSSSKDVTNAILYDKCSYWTAEMTSLSPAIGLTLSRTGSFGKMQRRRHFSYLFKIP
jgi:hypothetical protein